MILVAVCAFVGCTKDASFEQSRSEIRLKLREGYLDQALQLSEQAYSKSEGKDPVWHWRFRVLKAETLVRRASYKDALTLLEPEPPSSYPLDVVARRKTLQGLANCLSGSDYKAGEAAVREAISMAHSDPMLLAEATLASARCAWGQGELDKAEEEFRTAEDLAINVDAFLQASAAGNLAVMFARSYRFREALEKFKQVADLARSLHSPVLEEKAMINLSTCYAELGDFKEAISLAEQAQTIADQINNVGDQQSALINLGWTYTGIGEFDKAETALLRSLTLVQKIKDRDAIVLTYHDLAQLELLRRDINKAEAYWKEEETACASFDNGHPPPCHRGKKGELPELRSSQLALDHAEISLAQHRYKEAERLLQTMLNSFTMSLTLRSAAQSDFGTVYWREGRAQEADREFRAALVSAEKGFKELATDEQHLTFLDRDNFYDKYIEFLIAQHRPVDALGTAERNRAQAIAQRTHEAGQKEISFSPRALQTVLKGSKEVVLAYTVTDDQIFLWAITAEGCKPFTLPIGADLYPHIMRYNQEIDDRHSPEDSPEARTLYEKLILPAAKLIPRGAHVIVVPSRAVALVNFEALVVPSPQPHYWLEDVEVEYAGSLRGIVSSREKATAEGTSQDLLLVGAPVEANKEFPALQHAPEEIKNVQSHFAASREKVVTGSQAVPAAYRDSQPAKYRYIHFDTHGLNSDLSPLDSAIVLSAGPDKEYKLYARKIKDIPIHAELVTISACYGAGTRVYRAEGTIGLGWAFLRAGAHQVIAATWQIDDALTAKFMDDFYGELSQGKPAVDALHDAKLHMLHSTSFERHPYYWASLQLYTGY